MKSISGDLVTFFFFYKLSKTERIARAYRIRGKRNALWFWPFMANDYHELYLMSQESVVFEGVALEEHEVCIVLMRTSQKKSTEPKTSLENIELILHETTVSVYVQFNSKHLPSRCTSELQI
jgi:hypothetical protein